MPKTITRTETFEYADFGDASALTLQGHDLPPAGPGDVTVEVICAGISHIDEFIRSGAEPEWDEEWPRRSGSDFAGIVIDRGAGVTAFAKGAGVIGHVSSGAHATYLTVPASTLVAKPAGVTWETAGGLFLAGATALATLDELRIGPGDTVVISAAAGGVGSIEAQLAKHLGAHVIGTCGERNFDYLRQLGITPVKYGDGIAERIRRAARGESITAFIDNFGKDAGDLLDELGVPATRYRSSDDRRDLEMRLLSPDPVDVAVGTELLRRVTAYAQSGAFRLLVSGIYPLRDVAEAYADLQRLHARGKVILAAHPVSSNRTLRARDVHEAT